MATRGGFGFGLFLGLVVGAASGVLGAHLLRERGDGASARTQPAAARETAAIHAPPPASGPASAPPSAAAPNVQIVLEARRLRDENDSLRRRLDAVVNAQGAGESPVAAENKALRGELERARAALRDESAERRQLEGKPFPFPKDLPERYKQEALLRTVSDALKAAGVPGEVKSIDCSEYPCMVYGEARSPNDDAMKGSFKKALDDLARAYPYSENRWSVSRWQGRPNPGEDSQMQFGLAVTPKGDDSKIDPELQRRMRYRSQQYVDSLRPQ